MVWASERRAPCCAALLRSDEICYSKLSKQSRFRLCWKKSNSLIFRFFIIIDDLGPHSDVTLLGSYGVCGCPWWRRFSCLAFSWKPGSGRPTHGAWWLGGRQQEWRWSSGCFPRIRYQPESTRCPFDRPEVRQSHHEKESNEQQTSDDQQVRGSVQH